MRLCLHCYGVFVWPHLLSSVGVKDLVLQEEPQALPAPLALLAALQAAANGPFLWHGHLQRSKRGHLRRAPSSPAAIFCCCPRTWVKVKMPFRCLQMFGGWMFWKTAERGRLERWGRGLLWLDSVGASATYTHEQRPDDGRHKKGSLQTCCKNKAHLASSARCNSDRTLWPCGLSCISEDTCSWSSSDKQSAPDNVWFQHKQHRKCPGDASPVGPGGGVFGVTHPPAAVAVVSAKSEAEVWGAVHAHHRLRHWNQCWGLLSQTQA